MAISFACLEEALDPFVPRLTDLHLNDWLQPDRLLAKVTASNFGLRSGEFLVFDAWWELAKPAKKVALGGPNAESVRALDAEVRQAFVRLAAIVNDGAKSTERGYRYVHRVSGKGRFVIFSDHHMSFAGSRHDFFSKNSDLYAEILTAYADAGFTLVENGDVEELVIHEPMAPPPAAQLELLKQVGDTTDLEDRGWAALDELRVGWRLLQLRQVMENYKALYEQINTQFVEQDRYIRIAGNHDQDNQDARFLEELRTKYPKLKQVYDFLIIEPDDANGPTFVIGHGHHFDTASTPKYSRRIGETLSECLGWPYEGADRVWRWDRRDGVKDWASGQAAFLNTLVTDDPAAWQPKFTFGDVVVTGLAAYLGGAVGAVVGTLTGLAVLGGTAGMAASLADELSKPDFWEGFTFHKNIAWDYFRSSDSGEAIFNEVLCGQRWFKFRHLDEVFINQELERLFGAVAPYLVLGHSHEPRHRSWNPATRQEATHYLNSGSAGRFENLIWCIEIIDGVPQVVAWHRPAGAASGQAAERRTYTPTHAEIQPSFGLLIPSDQHVPLPPFAEEIKWLEAVLHVMMA